MNQICCEFSSNSSSRCFFRLVGCEEDAAVCLESSEEAQILQLTF